MKRRDAGTPTGSVVSGVYDADQRLDASPIYNRSIAEKIHAIQAHGIEVFGGMMLGFDSDDETIFDRQLKMVEGARIVHSSVGMVTTIPKTPLYERLERENRLDHADRTEYGTNAIPLKVGREALRDGYLRVLGELYSPANFFSRLDALYLEGGLGHSRLHHGGHNDGRIWAALPGWGEAETRKRAKEAGFDRHITKPADIGELEALLDCGPQEQRS